MSKPYRVCRRAREDDHYYVMAESPDEAIKMVTLRLADLEGMQAWKAIDTKPPFDVPHGDVVDKAGAPIQVVDL